MIEDWHRPGNHRMLTTSRAEIVGHQCHYFIATAFKFPAFVDRFEESLEVGGESRRVKVGHDMPSFCPNHPILACT